MSPEEITRLIKEALPGASVEIRDLAGDGDHYAVTVRAEEFRGKPRIQQHQLVYRAMGAHVGTTLHAMALTTLLPAD